MPHSTIHEASEVSSKQKSYISIPTTNANVRISEFSPSSLRRLAHVLYPFTGDNIDQASWDFYQRQEIRTLPPCLLQPQLYDPNQPQAPLCALHAPLNAFLIHKIYIEIISECTTRLETLANEPLGSLPPNVRHHMLRMQALNSLWMSEELYEQTYGADAMSYERVEGGCQACVLAAVGCDPDVVTDLMAAIYGRKRRHKPYDGLIHMVRQFILCLENGTALVVDARKLGKEIVKTRKQLQDERKIRRQQRRDMKKYMGKRKAPSVVSEEESSLGAILSYYFRLSSARQTAVATSQVKNSNSQYQDDVCFDEEKGFFYKVGSLAFPIPNATQARLFSQLSTSVYSQDEYIEARRESTMCKLTGSTVTLPRVDSILTQQMLSINARGKQTEEAGPKISRRSVRLSQPLKWKLGPVPEQREDSFQNAKAPSLTPLQRRQDLGEKRYTFYENPRTAPAPPVNLWWGQQIPVNRVTQMGDMMAHTMRAAKVR
jgi:hypothetical protein